MASSSRLIPILALMFLSSTFFFSSCEAKEILFGGHDNSWTIPPSADAFNKWAGSVRFKVGDYLIWKYDGKTDSVLEVSKENYESCNASKPIKAFKDGNTKFELDHSGPYYFISGAQGHCQKGQKVEVVVISDKHQPGGPGVSPVPSPTSVPAPAPGNSNSGGDGLMLSGLGLGLVAVVGAVVGFAVI